MQQFNTSNRRIALNSFFLYIRTIFILILSLYTSRVILKVLGEEDFGIYNVVGGVIVLFSFLTNAMTASTQRYLNYYMGLGDNNKLSLSFNVAIIAHFTIALIILLLGETIGIWFVSTQLNIPYVRMDAALWVYHYTLLATILNILVVPYRSSIIASEKMSFFALFSVIEAILKLVIVLVLPWIDIDSLVFYAFLLVVVSFVVMTMYYVCCRKTLCFTKFTNNWDIGLYKEMLSFSGWYLFGGVAVVGARQGGNILLNIFRGVSVNAAIGLANQIRAAIINFVSSFQTAFTPQIVKLCAAGDYDKLMDLLYRTTKFSFAFFYIIALPVMFCCESLLNIWLYEVPKYTVLFTQLVVATSVFDVLSTPLWTSIGAVGNIKKYQIIVSLILLSMLPFSYVALLSGLDVEIVFILDLIVNLFAFIFRVWFAQKIVGYNYCTYIKKSIMPCLLLSVTTIPVMFFIRQLGNNALMIFIEVPLGILVIGLFSLFIILNRNERIGLIKLLKSKL